MSDIVLKNIAYIELYIWVVLWVLYVYFCLECSRCVGVVMCIYNIVMSCAYMDLYLPLLYSRDRIMHYLHRPNSVYRTTQKH